MIIFVANFKLIVEYVFNVLGIDIYETAVRRPARHRTSTSDVGRFGSSPWASPPGSSGHNAGFSAYTQDTSCSAAAP